MTEELAIRFDLDLFLALNDEYRDKPLVPAPRSYDAGSLEAQSIRRLARVHKDVPLTGARVLEVGTARGYGAKVLADHFGCEVVGLDVVPYDDWASIRSPRIRFEERDLTDGSDYSDLGQFDAIVSFTVMEHVHHPHAMLQAMHNLLRPGGSVWLSANLYRGPKASHRYRDVFFPWPHLLFTDEVFADFYRKVHDREQTASWVNKLTYAHYLTYFDQIGFETVKTWLTSSTFDAAFYERFVDLLSRYPKFDLSHDFVYAVLRRRAADAPPTAAANEADRLRRELDKLHASTSWQVTAPLRKASEIAKRYKR